MTWQDWALIALVADRVLRAGWDAYQGAVEAARQERIVSEIEAETAKVQAETLKVQTQTDRVIRMADVQRWVVNDAGKRPS